MLCRLHERLKSRIGDHRYRAWFGETTELQLADDSLDVLVSNTFVGGWISNNFLPDLTTVARELCGETVVVRVRVAPVAPTTDVPPAAVFSPRAPEPEQRASGATRPIGLQHELDTFVVGRNNELAWSAARLVARDPGAAYKLLVIHGGCGLGKTHLLQGICAAVSRERPTLEWRYVAAEAFTNEFVAAVRANRVESFRARFRNVDLLVLDDLHFLANKKATQEEFLHTFNAIEAAGRCVVLSSDRDPRSISMLSEPLVDRLVSGMVARIEPPDLQTRIAILRRIANRWNYELSDEIAEFLARSIQKNVRELNGAVLKLVALRGISPQPLQLEQVRAALAEQLAGARRSPDLSEIVCAVAARFEVSREQIFSRSRDRTVSLARAVAMFLVRQHCVMSFPEIGRAFGDKNHSTVLMATQRIQRVLTADATVRWRTARGAHETSLRGLLGTLSRELTGADSVSLGPAA